MATFEPKESPVYATVPSQQPGTVAVQAPPQPAPAAAPPVLTRAEPEIRIYTHSQIFYWWPAWFVGYVMALLTLMGGVPIAIGNREVLIHPNQGVGVVYTVVLFLVILITNVAVRGLAFVVVILSVLFTTVLFAYLGWWDYILAWLPHLAVYQNLGFYLLFSSLILLFWTAAVLVYDHMSYWSIRPGQVSLVQIIGGSVRSFDTNGMVFEKMPEDLFRHRILGLGAGDIRIMVTGARREEIILPNVAFVDSKLEAMRRMVAAKPDMEGVPAV